MGGFRGDPPEAFAGENFPGEHFAEGDLFGEDTFTPDLPGDSGPGLTGEFSGDEAGGDMRTRVRARIKLIASERVCDFCSPERGFSLSVSVSVSGISYQQGLWWWCEATGQQIGSS